MYRSTVFPKYKLICPDIFVPHGMTALKFLRHFGDLIVNLRNNYSVKNDRYKEMFDEYFAKYACASLIRLSLSSCSKTFFSQHMQKPFKNLRFLCISHSAIGSEFFDINRSFPNLRSLELIENLYDNPAAVKINFINVTDFVFHDNIFDNYYKFDENDIVEVRNLNPQFVNLELCVYRLDSLDQFIAQLEECCPNLKSLKLADPCRDFQPFRPIHFERITKFAWYADAFLTNMDMFNFSNLQYLHIHKKDYQLALPAEYSSVLNLIRRSPHLRSLQLNLTLKRFEHIDFFNQLLSNERLLLNIEKFRIGILNARTSTDILMHFLTQNRSMKKFSLRGKYKYFFNLIDAIISGVYAFKIRNGYISEFIIPRATDNSSMKYILRKRKTYPWLYYGGACWECCSCD